MAYILTVNQQMNGWILNIKKTLGNDDDDDANWVNNHN